MLPYQSMGYLLAAFDKTHLITPNFEFILSYILGRQWYYLQCTQIGSFLLADDYTWISGQISIDFHLQKCRDVFGIE